MQRFTFKRGLRFIAGQTRWELDRRLASGKLQLCSEDGEILSLTYAELLQRWRSQEWLIDEQSLANLGNVIYVVADKDSDGETLTWAELSSRRMGDKRAIQSAMQAIADGRVKTVQVGKKLGDCVFLRDDVTQFFGTPLLEAGMSIQQLSKLTGWKWESISYWIEEGLLESESIQLRGRPCRVVLPHQLLAFRQSYVPLADLARGMGTKSSALTKLLPGIELIGARPLPDGAARGGLIKMAELGRLAVIGAKAGNDLFVAA